VVLQPDTAPSGNFYLPPHPTPPNKCDLPGKISSSGYPSGSTATDQTDQGIFQNPAMKAMQPPTHSGFSKNQNSQPPGTPQWIPKQTTKHKHQQNSTPTSGPPELVGRRWIYLPQNKTLSGIFMPPDHQWILNEIEGGPTTPKTKPSRQEQPSQKEPDHPRPPTRWDKPRPQWISQNNTTGQTSGQPPGVSTQTSGHQRANSAPPPTTPTVDSRPEQSGTAAANKPQPDQPPRTRKQTTRDPDITQQPSTPSQAQPPQKPQWISNQQQGPTTETQLDLNPQHPGQRQAQWILTHNQVSISPSTQRQTQAGKPRDYSWIFPSKPTSQPTPRDYQPGISADERCQSHRPKNQVAQQQHHQPYHKNKPAPPRDSGSPNTQAKTVDD